MNKKNTNFDWFAIILSLGITVGVSIFFLTNTENAIAIAGDIFSLISYSFGTPILVYAFGLVLIGLFIAFTKFGNIRMGNSKPDYSTFSYITMMALAGCGSGTVYWAFLEWSYYVSGPPFGIEPGTVTAREWAVTYSIHHWGIIAWAIYAITALPVAYSFYVRKKEHLKLGDVLKGMIKNPGLGKVIGRLTDILYPISLVFALIIVLALGVPIMSAAIAGLFGIADGFTLQLISIIAIAALLGVSSFFGLKKGMQKISRYGTYFIGALILYIFVLGPTRFILENTTSSVGLWLQNFIIMSLNTEAITTNGFPQDWTAYFWAYWMIFIPLMCVFITKVSKGRTLREIILGTIGGGTGGIILLFGTTASFMMKTEMDGLVPISQMLADGKASQSVTAAVQTLPFSTLALILFVLATFLLLITTFDGSVFTLACNTQNKLDANNNPSVWLKMFWVIVVVLIPATFMAVNAPVRSMQSAILIFALPLLIMTSYMLLKMLSYMKKDYSALSGEDIKKMHEIKE